MSFGSKCSILKELLVTLLGLFSAPRCHSAPVVVIRRPHSDLAPGELSPPCHYLVTPLPLQVMQRDNE